MNRETFEGTIRIFNQRTPYRPFTVALVNGERVEIDHPDALVVRGGVALFAGHGGVPSVFDHKGIAQITGGLAGNEAP